MVWRMILIGVVSGSVILVGACRNLTIDAVVSGNGTDADTDADTDTDTDTDADSDNEGVADLPCDIFEAAGAPCVSAHSSVRILRSEYTGPLYQLCKGEYQAGPNSCQGETLDIGAIDGYADVVAHTDFCGDDECTVSKLYDQAEHTSGPQNDLEPAPSGGAKNTPGNPVKASDLPVTIKGHEAYGMVFRPGMGYRAGCNGCNTPIGTDMATGDEPQTIYMVTSQHDTMNDCCFDYGNAETTCNNDHNGSAEAVYFGEGVIWGTGAGDGPWVMADLEDGLFPGWDSTYMTWSNIESAQSLPHDFVTAIVVGDTAEKNDGKGRFALYGGDAQNGELTEMYDGIRPDQPGYVPMAKQGSVVLSIAGDNSDGDGGRFYEGAIVKAALDRSVLDELQAAVAAAGYGRTESDTDTDTDTVGGSEFLCEQTDGEWDVGSCGNYVCGEFPTCDGLIPGCNCGTDSIFDSTVGCITSIECGACPDPDDPRVFYIEDSYDNPDICEVLLFSCAMSQTMIYSSCGCGCIQSEAQYQCETSGGEWDEESCGNYVCGGPPACDGLIPGCNCGTDSVVDPSTMRCVVSDECG